MWLTLYDTKKHKRTNPFEVDRVVVSAGSFYFVSRLKNFDMLADFCDGRVSFVVWEKADAIRCEFCYSDGWAFTATPYKTARDIKGDENEKCNYKGINDDNKRGRKGSRR